MLRLVLCLCAWCWPFSLQEQQPLTRPVSFPEKELACLAENVYHEARGESELGRLLVTQVVLNRAKTTGFCQAIYKRYQFSWTHQKPRKPSLEELSEYRLEILNLLHGFKQVPERYQHATHYHSISVQPRWGRRLQRLGQEGRHIFYHGV